MISYTISCENPAGQYLQIEMAIPEIEGDKLQLQMPAWRPGRYELGNFAKNVQAWRAEDIDGKFLPFEKRTKDLWEVTCKDIDTVVVKYNLYASELNAGSTYVDAEQLYLNPVNCLMYVPQRAGEDCSLSLNVPEDYLVAGSLRQTSGHQLWAPDFDRLADSPIIASATLQHQDFDLGGVQFHLWFQGIARPEWSRIQKDFMAFTGEQLKVFGAFPVEEYQYLFQVPPYPVYHGVEHERSTVIALGPGFELMKPEKYGEFLGISSHELFHTWNVKALRPAEMYPYDFTKENYSPLGYVAEGVTTYYGDYMLLRSGVWSFNEYCYKAGKVLNRHFHNYGRFNLSVAASSFDTWLDGYSEGAPNRKVSIYHKGALVALILDVRLRKRSNHKLSLDTVMRQLYEKFALQKIGFTEADYKGTIEAISDEDYTDFFQNYIWGTDALDEVLDEAFDFLGLAIKRVPSAFMAEQRLGFKLNEEMMVTAIAPGSPAEVAGLSLKDEVLSLNGIPLQEKYVLSLFAFFEKAKMKLTVRSRGNLRTLKLQGGSETYYPYHEVVKQEHPTAEQMRNFEAWAGHRWEAE
ncbi:MAG: PDZ domain-containing protein [Bacteroidia bacterium]